MIKVRIYAVIATMVTITMLLSVFFYSESLRAENQKIADSLKIAALALDHNDIEAVNGMILNRVNREAILHSKPYKSLVDKLKKIIKVLPVGSMWTYLIYPATKDEIDVIAGATSNGKHKIGEWMIISVLTIEPDKSINKTMPGFYYDMTPFPDLVEVVTGKSTTTVSSIVYDEVYGNWTRSGFIRIYNEQNKFIAVLGVDMEYQHIIKMVINSLVPAILYSSVITTFFTLIIKRRRENRLQKNNPQSGKDGA